MALLLLMQRYYFSVTKKATKYCYQVALIFREIPPVAGLEEYLKKLFLKSWANPLVLPKILRNFAE